MPGFDAVMTFFAASVLLALAPGPDNLFVLVHSAQHGRRAGLLVVLGLCTGLLFHTAAVALGLAAMLAASPSAFAILKLCGAAYLVWLAWGAWHAPTGLAGAAPQDPPMSAGKTYMRGVFMNLANPKVAIFFLAFLPQFADPSRGPLAIQILVLGGTFMVATLLSFATIAWTAARFAARFRRSARAQRGLNRLAASVLSLLALRLVLVPR